MKTSFNIPLSIFVLLFQIGTLSSVQAQGIEFHQGTFSDALDVAEQSGKLVFVDVFTDWCPPCKQMDRDILPRTDVGQVYNEHFVNVKVDAEKGAGPALVKQYEVGAFPTYLYLDPNGSLLHRAIGYYDANKFIQQAHHARKLMRSSTGIAEFDSAFEEGNRNRSFLREYIMRMKEVGLNNSKIINAYFAQLSEKDLTDPEILAFLSEMVNAADNNVLAFLLENFDVVKQVVVPDPTSNFFSILLDAASEAYQADHPLLVNQMLTSAERLLPAVNAKQRLTLYRLQLAHYGRVKNISRVKRSGRALVKGLMEIPKAQAQTEDMKRFDATMAPYLNGEQDSTKIEDFQEQKEFARTLYTREICSYLYESASAYANTLADTDPSLRLALRWATRCDELMPGTTPFEKLIRDLTTRVD